MLVLDEADEMLNGGFKEQVYDSMTSTDTFHLPPSTQVLLVSATMPHEAGDDAQIYGQSHPRFGQAR